MTHEVSDNVDVDALIEQTHGEGALQSVTAMPMRDSAFSAAFNVGHHPEIERQVNNQMTVLLRPFSE